MLISNHEQLTLLLRCLGMGVWLQLLWELDGVLFPRQRYHSFVSALKDFVLSLLCGLLVFIFALAVNGGEWRALMPVAFAVGGWVCHLTCGRVIRRLSHRIRHVFSAIAHAWRRGLQKGGDICKKTRKKLVFFYKKDLHKR